MKKLKFIFGKLSILYYILFLLVTCVLCKYGSIRQLKFAFLALGILLVLSLCIWIGCLIAEKENPLKMKGALRKTVFGTELLILLVVTVGCISYIVYTAIPYNGALSWKVDSLFKTKKIEYEHNNFFRDGAEGLIKDVNKKLKLPDELYITDSFEMSFDKDGTITRVSAYLYGQNEKGKDKTYLIDYDIDKSDKIVVQIAGYANADYDDDKKLDPMFTILEKSDCKMQVTQWNLDYAFADNPPEYEILYYGKRSFASSEGLVYLPGDVDGDGEVGGMTDFTALDSGGEALGYEVSLYLPQDESVTPVRYMMEPEYISPDTISQNEQAEKDSQAKEQGEDPYDLINKQIATSPIGANGITFLSFLQGAGGARINGKARGTFVGMTLGTRKADMARAVMEGICYEMYDIIRAEEDSGIKIDKIRLAGGAAKSPLWCQMMADIFKHPIQILENGEAGCLGAALYAGVGVGAYKDCHEAAKVARTTKEYTPNPDNYAAYDAAYKRFCDVYDALDKKIF